jgi:hypothetical protein
MWMSPREDVDNDRESTSMVNEYFRVLGEIMATESRMLSGFYRHREKLGENREALLQRFFSTYLPRRFAAGSGFALFGDGVSTQQDVVVYDQLNNPVLFPGTAAPLFPPSAVAAVVEVKSTLTNVELRQTVIKAKLLKENLRASFAHHPAPPQSEALAGLFSFRSRLSPAEVLEQMKTVEEEIGAGFRDRLDVICLLGQGIVLGGSLLYSTTNGGAPLLATTADPRRQRLAVEAENSLFIFYSRLLDYISGRGEVRPQLMSYMAPETPMGEIVAVG